jgi:hypothetical protein
MFFYDPFSDFLPPVILNHVYIFIYYEGLLRGREGKAIPVTGRGGS